MSENEFWERSPYLAKEYYKAHLLKIEQRNQELWMQGLYNFAAYSTALKNLNLDGKKRKPEKYLEKPIRITPLSDREKRIERENARQKIIESLTAWQKSWERQYGKGGA